MTERPACRSANCAAWWSAAFVDELAAAIRAQFPACRGAPGHPDRPARGERSSGPSAAGRALDPAAVRLAVVASVRHEDTDYDELLMGGMARFDARDRVRAAIDEILERRESGTIGS